jgi:hypothetical protein
MSTVGIVSLSSFFVLERQPVVAAGLQEIERTPCQKIKADFMCSQLFDFVKNAYLIRFLIPLLMLSVKHGFP